MSLLSKIKKIPLLRAVYANTWAQNAYHYSLGFLGALLYGFPSRSMYVIGVTGTKGKTSTCNLLAHLLNRSGLPTGMATTVNFRIRDTEWINETKQTMLGRFALQKMLWRMKAAGCTHAIVETSSEGILQFRHSFVDYSMAVFTNLSPEHIERHGGFENYRAAKVKLFEKVAKKKGAIGIFNLDDENVSYFLAPKIAKRSGFTREGKRFPGVSSYDLRHVVCAVEGSDFVLDNEKYHMPLLGEFNVANAASALCAARELGVSAQSLQEALKDARSAPGRMEIIRAEKGFTVVVDYSYEPTGLKNALSTLKLFDPSRIICVVGSAGGGRDTWRRPVMGGIAATMADVVIVTTDDPYEEDPDDIAKAVYQGAKNAATLVPDETLFKIVDRKEALRKAISMAREGDVILAAGKGGEKWMNVKEGKIPWDESAIVAELLRE